MSWHLIPSALCSPVLQYSTTRPADLTNWFLVCKRWYEHSKYECYIASAWRSLCAYEFPRAPTVARHRELYECEQRSRDEDGVGITWPPYLASEQAHSRWRKSRVENNWISSNCRTKLITSCDSTQMQVQKVLV